jgi:hypothetical protein
MVSPPPQGKTLGAPLQKQVLLKWPYFSVVSGEVICHIHDAKKQLPKHCTDSNNLYVFMTIKIHTVVFQIMTPCSRINSIKVILTLVYLG